jgi:hypothetical protein
MVVVSNMKIMGQYLLVYFSHFVGLVCFVSQTTALVLLCFLECWISLTSIIILFTYSFRIVKKLTIWNVLCFLNFYCLLSFLIG